MQGSGNGRAVMLFGLAIAVFAMAGCGGGATDQKQADSQLVPDSTKVALAMVKTDIRNLMSAQEKYFAEKKSYASDDTALDSVVEYRLSKGNALELSATDSSYTVTVTNTPTDQKCSVAVGGGGADDGKIVCP